MPTYSYRCTACGHGFEQFQRFSDDPLTVCPQCQGLVKRVLHPVGVVFKGSGWYITDSRKPPSENGGSEKPKQSDAKESKSEAGTKTESTEKPKAKAAAADD
jgi:putative FmdB family regulatory protein